MGLYFVHRPKMKGTRIPTFYYCFADSTEDAIQKVSLKWGEYDRFATARELSVEECDSLVIGLDNYYG